VLENQLADDAADRESDIETETERYSPRKRRNLGVSDIDAPPSSTGTPPKTSSNPSIIPSDQREKSELLTARDLGSLAVNEK
jgi:hypothetical protein